MAPASEHALKMPPGPGIATRWAQFTAKKITLTQPKLFGRNLSTEVAKEEELNIGGFLVACPVPAAPNETFASPAPSNKEEGESWDGQESPSCIHLSFSAVAEEFMDSESPLGPRRAGPPLL